MIEINLLPEELRKKEAVHFKMPDRVMLRKFALVLVGVLVFQFIISLFSFYQRIELLNLRNQVAAIKRENKELFLHKAETSAIRTRLRQIRYMMKRKFYWSSFLNALSDSMTKGVWLRQLSVGGAEQAPAARKAAAKEEKQPAVSPKAQFVKLDGSAIGPGQETAYIGKFIKGLKENSFFSELFSQIELSTINQRKIKEFDVYDFELACVFKKEGA